MPDESLVRGIEASCDETGIGTVRGRTLLADAVASSAPEKPVYGVNHLAAPVPVADVAALGARLVESGVTPGRLDLPADSALPLTTVTV